MIIRIKRRRPHPRKAHFWLVLIAVAVSCFAITLILTEKLNPDEAKEATLGFLSAKTEPQPYRYFASCDQARAAGRRNIPRGDPSYRPQLDADGDGLACEPYRHRSF